MTGRYPARVAGNGAGGIAPYWTGARARGNDAAALHEELLKSGYEAFNRRDSEHLRELMVPDFVWHEAAPLRPAGARPPG